jgi:hypothetical protein
MEMGRTRQGQICCIEGQQKSDGTVRMAKARGSNFRGHFGREGKKKKDGLFVPFLLPPIGHSPYAGTAFIPWGVRGKGNGAKVGKGRLRGKGKWALFCEGRQKRKGKGPKCGEEEGQQVYVHRWKNDFCCCRGGWRLDPSK